MFCKDVREGSLKSCTREYSSSSNRGLKLISESGRSMVEMLNVFAIMGLLTLGSIRLYHHLMDRTTATTIKDDILVRALLKASGRPNQRKAFSTELDSQTRQGHEISFSEDLHGYYYRYGVSNLSKGVCDQLVDLEWRAAQIRPVFARVNTGLYAFDNAAKMQGNPSCTLGNTNSVVLTFKKNMADRVGARPLEKVCQNDTDCSPSYTCVNGQCQAEAECLVGQIAWKGTCMAAAEVKPGVFCPENCVDCDPDTEQCMRCQNDLWLKGEDTYIQLEYISSSGEQYIDTGYSGFNKLGTELSFKIQANVSYGSGTSVWHYAFGIHNSDGEKGLFTLGFPSNPQAGSRTFRAYGASSHGVYANNISMGSTDILAGKMWADKKGYYIDVNGTKSLTSTSVTSYTYTKPFYLFSLTDGRWPTNMKLYFVTISHGETRARNYVPCYRMSDHEVGVCETVEGKFYANAGSGSFTAGPEVGPLTSDSGSGSFTAGPEAGPLTTEECVPCPEGATCDGTHTLYPSEEPEPPEEPAPPELSCPSSLAEVTDGACCTQLGGVWNSYISRCVNSLTTEYLDENGYLKSPQDEFFHGHADRCLAAGYYRDITYGCLPRKVDWSFWISGGISCYARPNGTDQVYVHTESECPNFVYSTKTVCEDAGFAWADTLGTCVLTRYF